MDPQRSSKDITQLNLNFNVKVYEKEKQSIIINEN